ncbi:MAG: hypothetical protein MZV65_35585, partial [Chromatiales bacterium]|nr:hypothetical protein [Chromatiales bacterium]
YASFSYVLLRLTQRHRQLSSAPSACERHGDGAELRLARHLAALPPVVGRWYQQAAVAHAKTRLAELAPRVGRAPPASPSAPSAAAGAAAPAAGW